MAKRAQMGVFFIGIAYEGIKDPFNGVQTGLSRPLAGKYTTNAKIAYTRFQRAEKPCYKLKGPVDMNVRQNHGVKALKSALAAAQNKKKGVAEDAEKIQKDLRELMNVIDHPVPNRRIEDYE